MPFSRAGWALLILLATAGAARAETLGACIWGKLAPGDQKRILAAYRQDMGVGAAALQKLARPLNAKAATCARRSDISADWVQTITGSEAVQTYTATALRIDRGKLDAAWAAAPPDVAACIRANGRLAFFSNGLGCSNPAASAWLLKRIGLDQSQQPAARQALYYFNARAIGEWGDKLVAGMSAKRR